MHFYYHPPNEVCEGYVFTPVCQSFCSQLGGGIHGQVPPLGRSTRQVHPPGRYTPQAGTPQSPPAGTPPGQQAGGTHPTGMHSCLRYFDSVTSKSCLVLSCLVFSVLMVVFLHGILLLSSQNFLIILICFIDNEC